MDIVYASLERRQPGEPVGEVAEVLSVLWAHARPEDGLEHASGLPESERLGLLLFMLSRDATAAEGGSPLERAGCLLDRCHRASPLLRGRYLPPRVPLSSPRPASP